MKYQVKQYNSIEDIYKYQVDVRGNPCEVHEFLSKEKAEQILMEYLNDKPGYWMIKVTNTQTGKWTGFLESKVNKGNDFMAVTLRI